MVRYSGLLGLVTVITTAILVFVNAMTSDIVKINQDKRLDSMRYEVLENAGRFEDVMEIVRSIDVKLSRDNIIVRSVYEGVDKNGRSVGYVINLTTNEGYNGLMELLVGVNSDLTVSGIKIISMSETPGRGDRVSEDEFLQRFIGKTEWVKHVRFKTDDPENIEVEGISGATISVLAVTNAVKEALIVAREMKVDEISPLNREQERLKALEELNKRSLVEMNDLNVEEAAEEAEEEDTID